MYGFDLRLRNGFARCCSPILIVCCEPWNCGANPHQLCVSSTSPRSFWVLLKGFRRYGRKHFAPFLHKTIYTVSPLSSVQTMSIMNTFMTLDRRGKMLPLGIREVGGRSSQYRLRRVDFLPWLSAYDIEKWDIEFEFPANDCKHIEVTRSRSIFCITNIATITFWAIWFSLKWSRGYHSETRLVFCRRAASRGDACVVELFCEQVHWADFLAINPYLELSF